jgi:hypothetical protein
LVKESATFEATLPPILSAVKVSGDGGLRIQLDVPQTDEADALKLLLWRERVLRITVEPAANCFTEDNNRALAQRTKRKPEWTPTERAGADGDTGGSR